MFPKLPDDEDHLGILLSEQVPESQWSLTKPEFRDFAMGSIGYAIDCKIVSSPTPRSLTDKEAGNLSALLSELLFFLKLTCWDLNTQFHLTRALGANGLKPLI